MRSSQHGSNEDTARHIDINVAEQRLRLWEGGTLLMCCAISTSKYGLGSEPGSNRTPLGLFRIAEKHGDGAAPGTIFKARVPVGHWSPDAPASAEDLITTRILWLDGLEPGNASTYDRYIYLHGTNQEHKLGTTASHGCVRLANDAVEKLYDLVPVNTRVRIHRTGENPPPNPAPALA